MMKFTMYSIGRLNLINEYVAQLEMVLLPYLFYNITDVVDFKNKKIKLCLTYGPFIGLEHNFKQTILVCNSCL